jgi:predicted patatin/cPLA2 family phospholipase
VIAMLGLVLEGGAMRAGFVAGAMMAFMDKNLVDFDAAAAVSASVPTLAYFASGQRAEMEKVWRDELTSPKLVCYQNIPAASFAMSKKRPVLNVDHLVYDIFQKKYPLDLNALLANKMACHFAAATVPNGEQAFLNPAGNNIYDLFKACMAVPGCYPTTVPMNGCEYVDGGTVCPLPLRGLLDKTVSRVVAILSKPMDCENEPPNFLERALFWRYFKKHDWMLEKLWDAAQDYNSQVSLLEQMAQEEPSRALIICPDKMPPVKFVTLDNKKINRTIDLGYSKVEELEDRIGRFLKRAPSPYAEKKENERESIANR